MQQDTDTHGASLDVLEHRIASYVPSSSRLDSVRHVPLLFMVGVSGAGKDTVLRTLLQKYPGYYEFMVSYTTRAIRSNQGIQEQDGVDYHFIDASTANRMLDEQRFVEVNWYARNLYGTGIDEIAKTGALLKTVVKDVDVNGVDNYMTLGMNLVPVFLLPPSYSVWRERVKGRAGAGTLDDTDARRRLEAAYTELKAAQDRSYYSVLVNDDLHETVDAIHTYMQGSHKKPLRSPEALEVLDKLIVATKGELSQPGTLDD